MPVPAEDQRLVEILAGMVRSALAWEENHGDPTKPEENDLTGIRRRIHWPAPKGRPLLRLIVGGQNDDDDE